MLFENITPFHCVVRRDNVAPIMSTVPNAKLVMDKAVIHRTNVIREECRLLGLNVIYLPSHSPELNPPTEEFIEFIATQLCLFFLQEQSHFIEKKRHTKDSDCITLAQ